MFDRLIQISDLPTSQFWLVLLVVFIAGLVRGFAGFGLSAVVMSSLVVLIPPVELIPICYILEASASIMMFRGGLREANMPVVWGLVIGSGIGVPIGLSATTVLDTDISKLAALLIVIALTAAQLLRLRPAFLATRPGLYATGIFAGIVTGLASVGGMVVALYVLASDAPAKRMRASLVMFLFIGMFTSLIYLVLFEVMNRQALYRGLVFTPSALAGVLAGTFLFRPSLIKVYKQLCLSLLLALCSAGIMQQVMNVR